MFVEHKEAVEITEAPAKVLKLSEAIRIGAGITKESFGTLSERGGCAIGAAYLALGGSVDEYHRQSYTGENLCKYVAKKTNTPFSVVDEAWTLHAQRTVKKDASRPDQRPFIAEWLAAQGY